MTTPSRLGALGSAASFRRAVASPLVIAACLGFAGTAFAGSYGHHRRAAAEDYNAFAGPVPAPGSSVGSWRFGIFGRRGGCDKSYPMHESSPCGSPTGGPVGGMGS